MNYLSNRIESLQEILTPKDVAVLAIIVLVLSTLLALALLPPDISRSDDMIWPGVTLALGLVIVPIMLSMHDFKAVFRAEYFLVITPVYWILLDLVQSAYPLVGLSHADVELALIAIATFSGSAWVSCLLPSWKLPGPILNAAKQDFSLRAYFNVALFTFTVSFLRFAIPSNFDIFEMVDALGRGRWDAPWTRGALGGWDAFLDFLAYFGYVLPVLTVIIAQKSGWRSFKTVLTAFLALIICVLIGQGGGRRLVGVMVGSAIVFWIVQQPKVQIRTTLIIAAVAATLLFSMELMLKYRDTGFEGSLSSFTAPRDKVLIHVDDNFLRLGQVVQIFPEHHDYLYGDYIFWVFVRPIPRVLWPGKPIDPGFDLARYLEEPWVAYSCSVIGELFMAGGLMAVLFGGWIYGRLAGMLSRLLDYREYPSALVIYSAGLLALFAGVRSMLELVLMSYVILVWLVLIKVLRLFVSATTPSTE